MAFGFFGLKMAKIVAAVAMLAAAPFAIGFLHDYAVLSGSLVAYAVSTMVCYFMCFRNQVTFDFATIKDRIGDFDNRAGSQPRRSRNHFLRRKRRNISMSEFFLTLYVLVWPVIVAGVLYVLGKAFIQEIRDAKREGRPLI